MKAVMDLSRVFEYGQGYVALSGYEGFLGFIFWLESGKAFQVHPEILFKDKGFENLQKEARAAFRKLPAGETYKYVRQLYLSFKWRIKIWQSR